MLRTIAVTGVALLSLALVVATGVSQGPKKSTSRLPTGWTKLGLSKDQRAKVYAIQDEYKGKIADLYKQIAEIRGEQTRKMVAVLTPAQKEKLRKLATGESDAPQREKQK